MQVFSTFSYYHQNTNFNRKCTGKKLLSSAWSHSFYYLNNSRFPDSFRKKIFCMLCLLYCLVAILIMLPAGLYLSNCIFFVTLQVFLFLLRSIWLISLISYPIFYFYLNFFLNSSDLISIIRLAFFLPFKRYFFLPNLTLSLCSSSFSPFPLSFSFISLLSSEFLTRWIFL